MTAGVFAKVAGSWVQVADPAGAGMTWAKVTGGTVTEYTKPDGSVMEVHTFTANGSLDVVTPGFADVLLVGGGSGYCTTGPTQGGGGDIIVGLHALPAGTLPVTVGAGAPVTAGLTTSMGNRSLLGTLGTAMAGYIAGSGSTANTDPAFKAGRSSDISGTAQVYGASLVAAPRANFGEANVGSGIGTSGIVIVAVQKSPPTVSGVVASGGTETTYVGDGVNGVSGQTYKVHKFTSSTANLVVTQGGQAEFLVVGGGSAASVNSPGYGGLVAQGLTELGAGIVPVTVGSIGAASALGGITARQGAGHAAPGWAVPGARTGHASQTEGGRGFVNSITGTAVEYGIGGSIGSSSATPNTGGGSDANGSWGGISAAGVVIVRYKVAA